MKTSKLVLTAFIMSMSAAVLAIEPINVDAVKASVIQYHDSGEYDKDIAKVVAEALVSLKQQLADPRNKNQKLAIILDIDETSLSNYPGMLKWNFGGTVESFMAEQDKGEDPVIKPTLNLYQFAKSHGVHVIFLTGRHDFEREATVSNLENAGYKNYDGLILRSEADRTTPAGIYKSAMREQLAASGYKIILNLGDQDSDLRGKHTGVTFKLPNPYYYIA